MAIKINCWNCGVNFGFEDAGNLIMKTCTLKNWANFSCYNCGKLNTWEKQKAVIQTANPIKVDAQGNPTPENPLQALVKILLGVG